ncbi:MAG: hypothetical protein WAR37_02010 [Candidatus Microsaccharimonas sp.]
MKFEYIYNPTTTFAQAYGTDAYGEQSYSCQTNDTSCYTTVTEGAPNTGFLGLSQDAAVASISGGLLIAVAVVGTVFVVISRVRSRKKNTQVK